MDKSNYLSHDKRVIVVPPLYKCKIFYFSVEPHSKEVTSKSIDSNDPWTFSGKLLYDSDKTALLFDIKPLSLETIFPGTEGRRYSAKWEEHFLGYVTQTTKNFKIQDFVLTVSAFGSHTDRNYVFTGLGFMEWKKATVLKRGILVSHNESRKHQDATSKAKTLSKDKKRYICLNLKIVCGKGQLEQGNYSTDHQHCGRLRSAKYSVPWTYLE